MLDPPWLEPALADWRQRGLERFTAPLPSADSLNFADNDYLNLARHPDVIAAATEMLKREGAGARAARLLAGNPTCHQDLEQSLATLKDCPAALLFGSGFLANLGVITALVGRGDTVLLDRLSHASLIDGARLSAARILRFRHNDPEHLRNLLKHTSAAHRRLVVTESIFSMDGDRAPLDALASVASDYEAMLLVDEAHATGIFGPAGSGLFHPRAYPDQTVMATATLSKALGAYGGFFAGSANLRHFLLQKARSFIYSTALPPAAAGAGAAALKICAQQNHLGPELLKRAAYFRQRLRNGGVDTAESDSQIVPVILGDDKYALRISTALRARGVFCPAIRTPTIPAGQARIRFSITLRHRIEDLDRTADLLMALLAST